jgi:hypothetical protein
MSKKNENTKAAKAEETFQSHAQIPKIRTAEGLRRERMRKLEKKEKNKAA